MSEQRKKILDMLADGKITSDEADRLLDAVENVSKTESEQKENNLNFEMPENLKARFLCVKVKKESDGFHKNKNVDIKIPLVLLKAGVKLGSIIPGNVKHKVSGDLGKHGINFDFNNLDSSNLNEFIEAITHNPIKIETEEETVKIFCA